MQDVLLTIAGSDSCSGAGIQRDTQVCCNLGVHALNVITAITAQNAHKVYEVESVSDNMFAAQLSALKDDFSIKVIKSGMLATVEQVLELAKLLKHRRDIVYICDPVMVATSGDMLMCTEVLDAIKKELLLRVDIFTPNLQEAQMLLSLKITKTITLSQMLNMAKKISELYGIKNVLLKGGHNKGNKAVDCYFNYKRNQVLWLSVNRFLNNSDTHGSGCTLSAAMGAFLVKGYDTNNSIVLAKAYISSAIKHAEKLSKKGSLFLKNSGFPADSNTFPKTYLNLRDLSFKKINKIDLYPVVDSSDWVLFLAKQGIKTIQLRIKNIPQEDIRNEVIQAIEYQNQYNLQLFINDYYNLAIEYGAFGVHLGHEDIVKIHECGSDVLDQIASENIALGLSTHDYYELSIASSLNPSYIALGPIFPTKTKKMKFSAQGINRISEWQKLVDLPLVAIGGIKESHITEIARTGVNGIAVVSLVTLADNPVTVINNIKILMN
ncbi:bifunctional hydroxymethylpyrimidine kinase/phosphomethylpyrimidine kinase [Francisella adeliensis]|uniref:hydroxymethylpyrimidine kinase n=1 Tax=Francisella adeliensis TaxID=2007306 RepID=A0A2Z4XZZ7_9GAMM|nr:bifunctional hydroxymethylpyrimidine kinase/phosphomethylpyrimidine kinase [Francisella adeliensis]AXA34461.1 bifunctional hydroxymethylpyrimidine kinase/phosphomethylpyrimidine kinase [Francisella adeliensis]MBK2086544.1 bifunctional hydroxymethylpyrimidine kinase/phosphomethylpyrimidine kinase [Francisella adeliensis]MBK2096397.1 bifunctional hydroxymethylpyrimidine kinase/phosphomethylpyrimidine kinase [Francisella adeliensis]QIW12708.1 bifunctional hydroxymethylpyrimidine kinase/phosphom